MASKWQSQIQPQTVWALNLFSSYPLCYFASLHVWQAYIPNYDYKFRELEQVLCLAKWMTNAQSF